MEGVYFTPDRSEVTITVPNKGEVKAQQFRLQEDMDLKKIEEDAASGWIAGLVEMSQCRHTDRVREAAGLKAVELNIKLGRWEELIDLSTDEYLPSNIRKAAADSILSAAMNAVERAKDGGYPVLIKLSKEQRLPSSIRKAAEDSIEASALSSIEWFVGEGYYDDIIRISENPDLPDRVRNIAASLAEDNGLKCVVDATERIVRQLDCTGNIPESVMVVLRKVCADLAAKRVANPIAGDGVLSAGKVKPPAAKEGCG